MPVIVHEGKERYLSPDEAENLLRRGLAHVPNPFDQGSLQPCPDFGWREIEEALSPGIGVVARPAEIGKVR